ncbi:MAG: Crp/Fnr family transcriptional regulator [Cocleimonas sp.]
MNLQAPIILDFPHTKCKQCRIRKLTLFQDISGERLDEVQAFRSSQLLIPARTNVFEEGDKHDFVYTFFSGWGVIYKTVSNNGKRQILRFLLPGELIGYQTNAKGAVVHSAGAITESILCAFPRAQLNKMLKTNPELAIRLVNMESRDMSICQNHLMAAGRKTAKESIAFVLLELYYRVQLQLKDSYDASSKTIDFPITQGDLGDAVGLTNIHVNRVIKELMKDKLIYCNKKRLSILNEEKLCSIAEFSPDMISSHL